MSFLRRLLFVGFCGLLAAALPALQVTYQGSDEDIPNPERGFSMTWINGSFSPAYMAQLRTQNHINLIRRIFALDNYRNTPIPAAALQSFQADFDAARAAGVKLVPRFAYNFDQAGPDASLDQILGHLAQLQPLLARNEDVIAFVQAGFVGRWGEWHDSSNDLDNNEARSAVLKKYLEVLPKDRMIALRYPQQKRDIFATQSNLSDGDAFGGGDLARVGFHNDCFLASDDDEGTFAKGFDSVEGIKAYMARETRYTVMGGETCNLCARSADCQVALSELARFHYSELGATYEPHVLKKWVDGACMPEVRRRLGYRFRLLDGDFPETAASGAAYHFKLELINDGFASPYNPRPLFLLLRPSRGGASVLLPLNADPRRWEAGEKQSLEFEASLPAGMAPGSYYLFLRLPDPEPSLSRRPEYCIRFANSGLWEPVTGSNWLKASVQIQ